MHSSIELLKKFEDEKQKVTWDILTPHIERGAVFLVAPELDMMGVAMAIALDQAPQVKTWLEKNSLKKMDLGDGKSWEKTPHKEIGEFLIVQPYVLFQAQ